MTKDRVTTITTSIGAGLLFATGALHMTAYGKVVAQFPAADMRALVGALWVSVGISLFLAALLAVAATPLFVVRRRAMLFIAAATPLSIAALQLVYLGLIPPTPLLILDAIVLIAGGVMGQQRQALPMAPAAQPSGAGAVA